MYSCISQSHSHTCIHVHVFIHVYMHMYTCIHIRAGKKVQKFESSFVCCAFEATFLLLQLSCHTHFNVCTCTLVQSKHVFNNVGEFQKRWGCVVGCFCLSPAMLNPSTISESNKTSTRYKAIIQFWKHSIASQGKSNIDKNTCKRSNIPSFLLTKFWMLFCNLCPSPNI